MRIRVKFTSSLLPSRNPPCPRLINYKKKKVFMLTNKDRQHLQYISNMTSSRLITHLHSRLQAPFHELLVMPTK